MYVIVLVDIDTHKSLVHWVGNDLQDAQNALLLYCETIKDENVECMVLSSNEIHIYKRINGWIVSNKILHTIATLHELEAWTAVSAE
jgi:aspartokinase